MAAIIHHRVDMAKGEAMVKVVMGEVARGNGEREHISSIETGIIAAILVTIKSRGMGEGIGTTASIGRLQSISLNLIKRIDGRIRTTIV